MELTSEQQFFEQIKKSRKSLIALPQNLTTDALASALALKLFLAKIGKEAVVVTTAAKQDGLAFLPGADGVQNNLPEGKTLVVTLNTAQKKLEEISYESQEDKVVIFLKPRGEEFTQQDLSFAAEQFAVDLIFVLQAESLENLGQLYDRHTDLFFETPKINIDHRPGNEYFGQFNLVDVTATSVAEILASLMQKYEQQVIDADIATCLLAGIIDKTGSFQDVHTTPKSFLLASELVALGARQQEIIKQIYKTKPLPLLKLWGRVLARMKIQPTEQVVHSVLAFNDFERAEAGPEYLLPAFKEFTNNLSGYKLLALASEPAKGQTNLLAAVHEQLPVEKFLAALGKDAKIIDSNFGNYKLVELTNAGDTLEQAEQLFLSSAEQI